MVGRGAFADALASALTKQAIRVERASADALPKAFRARQPDLVVIAADAAQRRGDSVVKQLQANGCTTPTLVICDAEPSESPPQGSAHVAYITPDGGVEDCARHAEELLGALLEDQVASTKATQQLTRRGGRAQAPRSAPGAQPTAASPAKPSPPRAQVPPKVAPTPSKLSAPAKSPGLRAAAPELKVTTSLRAAPAAHAKPAQAVAPTSAAPSRSPAFAKPVSAAPAKKPSLAARAPGQLTAAVKPTAPATAAHATSPPLSKAPTISAARSARIHNKTLETGVAALENRNNDSQLADSSPRDAALAGHVAPAQQTPTAAAPPPLDTTPRAAPPALPKPANDQSAPAEVKTAPRIPLRGHKRVDAAAQMPSQASATPKAATPQGQPTKPADLPPVTAREAPGQGPPALPRSRAAQQTPPAKTGDSSTAMRASELEIAIAVSDAPPPTLEPAPLAGGPLHDEVHPRERAKPTGETHAAATQPHVPLIARPIEHARERAAPAADAQKNSPETARNLDARATRDPAPSSPRAGKATPPATLAARTATSQTTALGPPELPARAPRNPLEPASPTNPSLPTSAHSLPAHAPRNPLEPVTHPNLAPAHSLPARAPGSPLEPATNPRLPTQAQSLPAHAPRNPLEPVTRPNPAQAQSLPARAPRNPLEPVTRPNPAPAQSLPARAPRNPLEPTPYHADATPAASLPARAPRDPFAPAPRAEPPPMAAPAEAANRARLPLEPAQRLPDIPLTTPATVVARKPAPFRAVWMLGAAAAIGASAFWLYHTYDPFAPDSPGNAATGALVHTPVLAEQPAAPSAPQVQPDADKQAAEAAEPPATAERRVATVRRASEARDAAPTTAAGRARALVDSGAAMLRQRRYGIAEGMYMKALQEVPEYPPAMADLVRVHLARRDGKEAVRWAELLVSKQNNALHQLLLGDAQALRGNGDAARTAWTKAAERGNATARQRLSEVE